LKEGKLLVRNSVAVLVDEALSFVLNIDSVVSNCELVTAKPGLLEDSLVLRLIELLVELADERRVRARREPRLLVEERKDAKLALNDVNARLVVRVVDKRPVDLFADVFLLFKLEDVSVKLVGGRRARKSAEARKEGNRGGSHLLLDCEDEKTEGISWASEIQRNREGRHSRFSFA
jgi:hypothetical protein